MRSNWWQLPGPRRFISVLAQDLREGKNLVVRLPEFSPDGLYLALERHLQEEADWHIQRMTWSPTKHVSPVEMLVEQFIPDPDPAALWNTNYLAQQDDFNSRLFWVHSISVGTWPIWHKFIVDYAHACRAKPLSERALFVILLDGSLAGETVESDVCLSQHDWHGFVDRLDMLLYASETIAETGMTYLQKQVALAVIANLALWDPKVADVMASQRLEVILNPTRTLYEIAVSRSWDRLSPADYSWHRGTTGTVFGQEPKLHSALLTNHESAGELKRRIWSGQVGVVFPYIEEHRCRIVKELEGRLQLPFTTRFGVIENLYDLEVGHIEAQVVHHSLQLSRSDRRFLGRLRQMRNCLAHMEILGPELLV